MFRSMWQKISDFFGVKQVVNSHNQNSGASIMDIIFTGQVVDTLEGLSVQAKVDGQTVACKFTSEILQDIDTSQRFEDKATQFESNKSTLQNIARQKIVSGNIKSGSIIIDRSDIPKN